jgi:histidine ammonia-lyase
MIAIDGQKLTLEQIARVAIDHEEVSLTEEARARIERARKTVERVIEEDRTVYGINTGFGKLSEVRISKEDLTQLQLNLVRSHSCGVGPALSEEESRAMVLLRANVLTLGRSGTRTVVVESLINLLNKKVTPIIPEKGSAGASGDLAPLAHLALTLIGEGEAIFNGQKVSADRALKSASLRPLQLEAKEGLALVNGTQAMAAVGGLATKRAERVTELADLAGAMSLEALRGTPEAFDQRIQEARPHAGQIEVATHLRDILSGSEIRESHLENDPRVQDAYSLRCMPQVHGAVRDTLRFVRGVVETETASATDNPLVFSETNEVLSGGNFHGAPLALAFDFASIALVHMASMSERRIDRLINPDVNEGLPPFLTSHPGTSSGYMIAHVTAVSLLNESKVLAHPASTDNVPTSGGKEDHVSMGMTAAIKLRKVAEAVEQILAIELLCAAEGLDYRAPLKPGIGVRVVYEKVRSLVPRLTHDRVLSVDILKLASEIRAGDFGNI